MVKLLTKAPEEMVPSPHVGHSPPIARRCCQIGPAATLLRLYVYSTPFLLARLSSWSPAVSVVNVGVTPQSESKVSASKGSCQLLFTARVLASIATTDWASFCVYWLMVPVSTKTVFVA